MSLLELRIEQLAVFADAVVPFGPGFTALTGETGAGKSVCVGALRLALGERSDGDPLRTGSATARVRAVFDDVPAALRQRLDELGVPADELLTLTRELIRGGRGSCRVNGALVSLAVLREVGEVLAEVTLQGASHRLQRRSRQLELLDIAAGATALRDQVRAAVGAWRAAQAALAEVRNRLAAGAAEIEAARQLLDDLGPLALRAGEDEPLAAERLRLRSAAAIASAAVALRRGAAGDEEAVGAADLLAAAIDPAGVLAGVDPGLDAVVAEAVELMERLRDLGAGARSLAESTGLDGDRLAAVEERLDVLARVRRRHGSVELALEALGSAQELLSAGEDGGARLEAAEAAVVDAAARVARLALELSDRRRGAARRLESEVDAALRRLELPRARFRVALQRHGHPDGVEVGGLTARCGPTGIDEVDFKLASDGGAEPRSLDDGPSGGELSRLVLALAACVTEAGSPLLVLDEVDAGIGGETAARVGDLLAAIGQHRQVVAITHRAEIASRAHGHLLVRRRDTPTRATAAVVAVDGEPRLEEIARLMSGNVTPAALARAVELRGEAVPTTGSRSRQRRPRVAHR